MAPQSPTGLETATVPVVPAADTTTRIPNSGDHTELAQVAVGIPVRLLQLRPSNDIRARGEPNDWVATKARN